MVLLFVNVSDENVPVQVRFEAAANGVRESVLQVHRLTTSGSKADWQNLPASFAYPMNLPPRKAEAWELEW